MGKNKLQRFAENRLLKNFFQPSYHDVQENGYELKGKWNKFFKNSNPITLELGCGKGEYTINLARRFPQRNFIGVDIKGARMWKGAKTAIEENINNVAFLRTQIDSIAHFFSQKDQIDAIWITFPDPHPKKSAIRRRLSHLKFLEKYRQFAIKNTNVYLKTDSQLMFNFTKSVIQKESINIIQESQNVHNEFKNHILVDVTTFYEKKWLEEGKSIYFLQFKLFPQNRK